MRPTFTVDQQDSLELAARKLRENGAGVLPVTQDGFFAGAITESSLASALAAGMELTDPVHDISQGALTAKGSTTGAEALRLFENQTASALVVVDDAGRVLGILAPSDLYPKKIVPPRPPLVGGMATPFGVYLTTGSLRAGVGHLALVTTGFTLFGMFLAASVVTDCLRGWMQHHGLSEAQANLASTPLPFILFLGAMRAIPLSSIHAAEHKVVHAIERGEELVPSTVRRMPRVHPRCGTNLAVGASLFVSLGTSKIFDTKLFPIQLLCSAIITLILWRPLGNLMQYYVTTKRPSEKHLAMGIRSGRELLDKYAQSGGAGASFFQRIVNSGMLHVMAGSFLAFGITCAIVAAFNLPIGMF